DIPSEVVAEIVAAGKFHATDDYAVLAEADAVAICVPTPLGKAKDPDISYIVAAVDALAKYVHAGMLVVLESTTYPGTTEEILWPKVVQNGYTVGEDFFLAFSPERVDPGNKRYNTRNTPKVVGGATPACLEVASALYATAVDTIVPVSSTAVAEMTKILENTFRAVNIGLLNELAIICYRLGIDVWEVIGAASTKPFGFMPFYPGPGLGGHCIPIDPLYLTWKARGAGIQTRFIELADTVNSDMPHYVVSRIVDALNDEGKPVKNARFLILGVAYKGDINDVRESPALTIIQELEKRGGRVVYNDPHVAQLRTLSGEVLESATLSEDLLGWADCVLVHTAHSA
ncbi:MAG: UDP-N-acetyl-D-glucosamine dehydrogenase, partial [Chloroflexi bacterium RBG_13_56_8]